MEPQSFIKGADAARTWLKESPLANPHSSQDEIIACIFSKFSPKKDSGIATIGTSTIQIKRGRLEATQLKNIFTAIFREALLGEVKEKEDFSIIDDLVKKIILAKEKGLLEEDQFDTLAAHSFEKLTLLSEKTSENIPKIISLISKMEQSSPFSEGTKKFSAFLTFKNKFLTIAEKNAPSMRRSATEFLTNLKDAKDSAAITEAFKEFRTTNDREEGIKIVQGLISKNTHLDFKSDIEYLKSELFSPSNDKKKPEDFIPTAEELTKTIERKISDIKGFIDSLKPLRETLGDDMPDTGALETTLQTLERESQAAKTLGKIAANKRDAAKYKELSSIAEPFSMTKESAKQELWLPRSKKVFDEFFAIKPNESGTDEQKILEEIEKLTSPLHQTEEDTLFFADILFEELKSRADVYAEIEKCAASMRELNSDSKKEQERASLGKTFKEKTEQEKAFVQKANELIDKAYQRRSSLLFTMPPQEEGFMAKIYKLGDKISAFFSFRTPPSTALKPSPKGPKLPPGLLKPEEPVKPKAEPVQKKIEEKILPKPLQPQEPPTTRAETTPPKPLKPEELLRPLPKPWQPQKPFKPREETIPPKPLIPEEPVKPKAEPVQIKIEEKIRPKPLQPQEPLKAKEETTVSKPLKSEELKTPEPAQKEVLALGQEIQKFIVKASDPLFWERNQALFEDILRPASALRMPGTFRLVQEDLEKYCQKAQESYSAALKKLKRIRIFISKIEKKEKTFKTQIPQTEQLSELRATAKENAFLASAVAMISSNALMKIQLARISDVYRTLKTVQWDTSPSKEAFEKTGNLLAQCLNLMYQEPKIIHDEKSYKEIQEKWTSPVQSAEEVQKRLEEISLLMEKALKDEYQILKQKISETIDPTTIPSAIQQRAQLLNKTHSLEKAKKLQETLSLLKELVWSCAELYTEMERNFKDFNETKENFDILEKNISFWNKMLWEARGCQEWSIKRLSALEGTGGF